MTSLYSYVNSPSIPPKALQPHQYPNAMLRAAFKRIRSNLTGRISRRRQINIDDYNIVQEGSAKILFEKEETVFYNPIQQFNRDLSVTCIKAWDNLYGSCGHKAQRKAVADLSSDAEPAHKKRKTNAGAAATAGQRKPYIRILEALSATGLRAIRYAHEIPNVKEIVANDLLPAAVESINRNIEYNGVQDIVRGNQDDANVLMYRNKAENKTYNVIDLDPYGTVTPFVDASMQSIEDGGLMLVTCTDLSVLAGNGYPEKCFALYGGVNMVGHEATHESALRLVLNLLSQSAAKYKKTVEPLLSLSIDFYVRVFIRVRTAPIEVKKLMSNTMVTYHCSQCGSFSNQPLGRVTERAGKRDPAKVQTKYSVAQGPPVDQKCAFCGGTHHLAGPMYGGALHNREFLQEVLRINREEHGDDVYGTRKRIEGMVTLAQNELSDAPFYFSPNRLASIIKLQVPALKTMVAGLGSLGYDCSLTHAQPSTLKTNAPWGAIWFVLRACDQNKDQQGKLLKMNPKTPGYRILQGLDKWLETQELFDASKLSFEPNEQSGHVEKLRKLKIVRYQENPTKNWGPKARPK
ncbi:tRNA (guanine26-N2)-dimethyltransferase [Maudiozyma humilis]|uniref:tRNA (guanine(26)-N(2))-dimethyltransferase n=1 Tax=Maudiozyma humilis TaxID=51915 RepID=A0AAV5RV91_MAUHU|nr:tRNA (guanine26-N2)-dimethyltransferase [Kazachstania humilis]